MNCGRASGKAILLGEHFVVYGAPALAVPLTSRGVEVETGFDGGQWEVPELCRPLLEKMLLSLGLNASETKVRVTGDLPLGQGLGGSAALAVALLRQAGHDALVETECRQLLLERHRRVAVGIEADLDRHELDRVLLREPARARVLLLPPPADEAGQDLDMCHVTCEV